MDRRFEDFMEKIPEFILETVILLIKSR